MHARYLILTYWQVYGAMALSGLALFWTGWAACVIARPARPARHRHRRPDRAHLRDRWLSEPPAPPAPLPALPPVAAAVIDARHANAMARTAPREPRPLARAGAALGALTTTLGMTAITAYVVDTWARKDRPGARPWAEATGTLTAVMLEPDPAEAATAPGYRPRVTP